MFIKHGDGTIVKVLEEEEDLTEEQKKKTAKNLSAKQNIEQSKDPKPENN